MQVSNELGHQAAIMNQLVSALTGGGLAPEAKASSLMLGGDNQVLPEVLVNLHSSGHQQMQEFRRQEQAHAVASKPAGDKAAGSAMDVAGILAGVRGVIGQSMAEVKRSQIQPLVSSGGGSLAPSSHFDDDSVNGSDDNCGDNNVENRAPAGASNQKRKGLPPIAPVKSEDLSEMPSNLSAEDQKKMKRRISNRECARRIRQRRQEQLVQLKDRTDVLRQENAKLMIRLTEVMKCWHEVAGENRVLKSQLSSMHKHQGGNPQANTIISAMLNGGSGSSGANSLIKVLERSTAQAKATTQAQELMSSNGFAADAIRAVLGPEAGVSPSGEELNPMDFLGVGSGSVHTSIQPGSDVVAHAASALLV